MTAHVDTLSYIESLLIELHNPVVLVPEIIGLSYIVYLAAGSAPEIYKKSQEGFRALMQVLLKF